MRRALLATVIALPACAQPAPPAVHSAAHSVVDRGLGQDPPTTIAIALDRPDPPRASRSRQAPRAPERRRVSSTAYCQSGTTASGRHTYEGEAAMNGVPLGSAWRVVETGRVYAVLDRIGSGSGFDVFLNDCNEARRYGRRAVTVERVA